MSSTVKALSNLKGSYSFVVLACFHQKACKKTFCCTHFTNISLKSLTFLKPCFRIERGNNLISQNWMRNKSLRICSTIFYNASCCFYQAILPNKDIWPENGGRRCGSGEVQHFLLRPLLSWPHTQNITEEEAQLPSSPGYNRD